MKTINEHANSIIAALENLNMLPISDDGLRDCYREIWRHLQGDFIPTTKHEERIYIKTNYRLGVHVMFPNLRQSRLHLTRATVRSFLILKALHNATPPVIERNDINPNNCL